MMNISVNQEVWRNSLETNSVDVFDLFDLILYVPFNNLSVMSGQIFLG